MTRVTIIRGEIRWLIVDYPYSAWFCMGTHGKTGLRHSFQLDMLIYMHIKLAHQFCFYIVFTPRMIQKMSPLIFCLLLIWRFLSTITEKNIQRLWANTFYHPFTWFAWTKNVEHFNTKILPTTPMCSFFNEFRYPIPFLTTSIFENCEYLLSVNIYYP